MIKRRDRWDIYNIYLRIIIISISFDELFIPKIKLSGELFFSFIFFLIRWTCISVWNIVTYLLSMNLCLVILESDSWTVYIHTVLMTATKKKYRRHWKDWKDNFSSHFWFSAHIKHRRNFFHTKKNASISFSWSQKLKDKT